ncbi:MAG: TRAP transporter small permease [Rhodospirillaceae bacterium]
MRLIAALNRRLADLLCWIGGAALVWMMLQVTADALLRYTFNAPIDATVEMISAYAMVAVAFLPLAYVTRADAHITVTLFTNRLSPRASRWLDQTVRAVVFVVLALLVVYTVDEALFRTDQGEIRDAGNVLLPVWPSRWFIPIGAAAMALHVALSAFVAGRERTEPRP